MLFLALLFFCAPLYTHAISGLPSVVTYNGTLRNTSGTALGGSGTTYYFKFSLWDASTGGLKVWPSSAPATTTATVANGAFTVSIGDIGNGYPDALTYNFTSPAAVFLQTEVSADNTTFETITPRQQVTTNPSVFGTSTPLGVSVLSIAATTTSSVGLTIQALLNQVANLFQVQNSSGSNLIYINGTGGLQASSTLQVTGATTLYAALTGTTASFSGTGTSTFSGGLSTAGLATSNGLTITAGTLLSSVVATSTFSNGTNITGGCYAINGSCLSLSGGNISSVANSDGTLTISPTIGSVVASLNLGKANTWTAAQTFSALTSLAQASSTRLSVVDRIFVGGTATSSIYGDTSTSTFSGPLGSVSGNLTIGSAGTTNNILLNPYGGSVGIASTSPVATLSVNGSGYFTTGLGVGKATTTTNALEVSGQAVFGSFVSASTLNTTSATASSTFAGGLSTVGLASSNGLTITGGILNSTVSGTSTLSNGLNITGCYAVNATCLSLIGNITSVSNADSSLTISPTTGSVVASLNLGNAYTWTALEKFTNASTTLFSVTDRLTVGGTATSTIYGDTSTSTFSGGVSTAGLASSGGLTITGGILNSTVSATSTLSNGFNITSNCYSIGGTCLPLAGNVSSLSNSNGSLTISPTTGLVVASLNRANANTWTALQQFTAQASTTQLSVVDRIFVGGTATTTLYGDTSTSTFSGGLSAASLASSGGLTVTGGAIISTVVSTTTFSNGLNITGCYAVNATCLSVIGNVTSVSNSDGSLTISPTTGAVVASLNMANANTWTALQQFSAQASSTRLSVVDRIYIGGTATTTLYGDTSTSTFSGPLGSTSGAGNLIIGSAGTTNNILLNPYGGSVGIGSSTPAQTLSVVGSGYLTGGLGVGRATTTTGALDVTSQAVFGSFVAASTLNATSTTASSTFQGLVGIGGNLVTGGFASASTFNATSTTATSTFGGGVAANLLSVTSTSASSTFSNGINLTGGCFSISNTCVGGAAASTGNAGQFSFYSAANTLAATSSIFANTNSYIGIGTTTPQSLLALHGLAPAITLGDTQANAREFQLRNGALGIGKFDIFDLGNNASRFIIDERGNVGIGSAATTSLTAVLYVSASSTAQTILKTTTADFSVNGATTTGGVATSSGQILLPFSTTTANTLAAFQGSFKAGPTVVGTAASLASRGAHSILRPDGKFLVILGNNTSDTSIYDPVTNTSIAGPALVGTVGGPKAGDGAHTIRRPDGRFLVIFGGVTATSSTGIYDPVNNTFVAGPAVVGTSASLVDYGAHSIQRPDGKWLVILGNASSNTSIYDPVNNTFVAGPSIVGTASNNADSGAHSIQRPDGKFLVILGTTGSTSLYDPVANTFVAGPAVVGTAASNVTIGAHSIQRPDGKFVVILGGSTSNTSIYDPVANTFVAGPAIVGTAANTTGEGSHSFQRPDGKFLVILSDATSNTSIYDPIINTFSAGPALVGTAGSAVDRGSHSFQRPDGKFLVIVGGNTSNTSIYDPGWITAGSYESEPMNAPNLNPSSVLKWTQNSEGIIQASVRTASTNSGLGSATYSTTTNGAYIYPNSGDVWVQVKFTLTRTIPQNNQPQQPTYNKNVWLGESDTKYFRQFDTPTVYDFTVDNSAVFRKGNADFGSGYATSTSLGNATSTIPILNNLVGGDGGLTLPYGFVSATSSVATSTVLGNYFASSSSPVGTLAGSLPYAGSHTIQRPDGTFLTILGSSTANTSIYDPLAPLTGSTWRAGPALVGPSWNNASSTAHSFQRPDGTFLVIMGSSTVNTSIYNPTTNTFVAGPLLSNVASYGTHSIQRPDGKFLVVLGGSTQNTSLYDPIANSFSTSSPLVGTAAVLAGAGSHSIQRPDGKFLTVLGDATSNTSIYDPVANTFVPGPAVVGTAANNVNQGGHSIQRSDGKFLLIQGGNTANTAIYDPVANTFTAGPQIIGTGANTAATGAHSIQRADGTFLVILGNNSSHTALYDPVANTFVGGPSLGNLVGQGAHSFQRSDGKYVTIVGNLFASTTIYSAGWVTSGFYQSELINNASLTPQSTLVWTGNADSFKPGAVSFQVRTSSSLANIASTTWRTLPTSGSLLGAVSGDAWMQVRINMQRSIPSQPGSERNVWLGESSVVYNRLPLQAGAGIPSVNQAQVFTKPVITSYKVINADNSDLASFALNGQSLFRFSVGGDAYTQPGGSWNSGGADVAEYFPTDDFTLEPGDVVSIPLNKGGARVCEGGGCDSAGPQSSDGAGLIAKSTGTYDKTILGIITTTPGIKLGSDIQGGNAGKQPVALAGRVPLKVNFENGPIHKGDPLTSSSIAGIAMKATDAGRVVALALEDFTSTDFNEGKKTILAFVNPHEYSGQGGFFSTLGSKLSLWSASVQASLAPLNMFASNGTLTIGERIENREWTIERNAMLSVYNNKSATTTLLTLQGREDQSAPLFSISGYLPSPAPLTKRSCRVGEAEEFCTGESLLLGDSALPLGKGAEGNVPQSSDGASLSTFLTLTANGNLGLGTSSPSSLLTLAGSAPAITLSDTLCHSDPSVIPANAGNQGAELDSRFHGNDRGDCDWLLRSSGGSFSIATSTSASSLFTLTSSGTVGIGSSSPSALLTLAGSNPSQTTLSLTSALNQTAPLLDLRLGSGTSALVLDSQGRLGLGTSSPLHTLDVQGDISASAYLLSPQLATWNLQLGTTSSSSSLTEKIKNLSFGCSPSPLTKRGIEGEFGTPQSRGLASSSLEEEQGRGCGGFSLTNPPQEILSASGGLPQEGGNIDLYKLGTFALAGVQGHQTKIEELESRLLRLETFVGTTTPAGDSLFTTLKSVGTDIIKGVVSFINIFTDTTTAERLCLNQTCITKDQLQGLLANANLSALQSGTTSVSSAETMLTVSTSVVTTTPALPPEPTTSNQPPTTGTTTSPSEILPFPPEAGPHVAEEKGALPSEAGEISTSTVSADGLNSPPSLEASAGHSPSSPTPSERLGTSPTPPFPPEADPSFGGSKEESGAGATSSDTSASQPTPPEPAPAPEPTIVPAPAVSDTSTEPTTTTETITPVNI